MKNSSKYIFIFISILFLNNIVSASNNKVFREDFDQEKGLIVLNKLHNSFNNFEESFNKYKADNWEDQFKSLAISRNRIEIALRSAELTKNLEEKWDIKDKETISPRKIQKITWENSKINLIPYALNLFEQTNPFTKDLWNIEQECHKIRQENSEELARIMEEEGDREERDEARVYFKYKKLKEKKEEEIKEKDPKAHFFKDPDYQKYSSNQANSVRKLKELASISSIRNLPAASDYDKIFNDLRDQKLPLFNELQNLKKLANEMVKIYFN